MYVCTVVTALRGGSGPHSSSISDSTLTMRLARSSSSASTLRIFGGVGVSGCPEWVASSGPRILNSGITFPLPRVLLLRKLARLANGHQANHPPSAAPSRERSVRPARPEYRAATFDTPARRPGGLG